MVILTISFLLPVTPNDYWWYVRVGQDTLQSGAIPTVDALSYTRAGTPVVYHSWLSAVIFWLVYQAGGISLTFILRAVLLASVYGLVWLTVRQLGSGPRLSLILTLFAALAGASNWTFRPQLLAYPLFALAAWVLWRWQDGKNDRMWLLPVICALWVNLHGSFVLLFPLGGVALVFGRGDRKRLLGWGLAALAATLLNPRGLGAWNYVVSLLVDPSSQVYSVEWQPPVNDNWHMTIFFTWLLVFPLITAFSTRRLTLMEWAWFLGFGLLALTGLRYVVWFLLLLAPLTAILLADFSGKTIDRPAPKTIPAMNIVLGVVFLLETLLFVPGVREKVLKTADIPVTMDTPVETVAWLKAHPNLPGPLWADLESSSYLVFALPERPVWVDTRFEVYPLAQWEEYQSIVHAAPGWQASLDRYGINLLLLNRDNQPVLVSATQDSKNWCPAYQDDQFILLSRCPQ